MNYTNLTKVALISAGVASPLLGISANNAATEEQKPNIILLLADDLGWGDVAFNGNTEVMTPHLDGMVEDGVRFANFYTSSPISSPSRGSYLTGRHPFRFGVLAAHTAGLKQAEVTIAEICQKNGYTTGMFGKWHLGWLTPETTGSRGMYSPPWQHGFEETFVTQSAVPTWDPTKNPENFKGWDGKGQGGGPWNGSYYMTNGVRETENLDGDDSRIIMDRVIPFIEDAVEEGKPFLSCVWFHTPHEPVIAGPEYLEMYKDIENETKQHYYGCITAMDDQIGRLRAKLEELGIADNTIIFFASDNGPADPLVAKKAASAGDFRGHKHTMYDGGMRVPSMAVWPGNIEAGSVVETQMASYDYLPTLVDMADLNFKMSKDYKLDGISMLPAIQGEPMVRDTTMFLAWMRLYRDVNARALIGERYKIVFLEHSDEPELYDLQNDPYETTNIIDQEPEIAKQMLEELEAWEKSCQYSRDGGDYSSY